MIARRKPIERGGPDVPVGDLIAAAYSGNLKKFRELLDRGADINEVEAKTGFTSLHVACLRGHVALAEEIIDYEGKTAAVDFQIRSLHRPRLAWQIAMNSHFYKLARLVDDAGLQKIGSPRLS